MRDGWNTTELGKIADFIDYRGKTPPKQSFGIPLITAKIIKKNRVQEPNEFIACNFYDEWMRRGIPNKGDVIFTTEAPLGEVALIKTDEKQAFAQRIIILQAKADILDSTFLFYTLQYSKTKSRIESRSSGTTVFGIKSAELKKVKIDYPSFPEQRAISATLSCLDDKIELNNKISANLEAQAQAIFKSWFVDFEPFQDGEFVDSELGPIPKGWRVGSLGDIARYVTERMPTKYCNAENYISTENMLANKQGVVSAYSLPSTPAASRYVERDILISNIRPYFKKIWFANKIGGCSNDVLVIRARHKYLSGLLYSILYSDAFFDYATVTSKGTKMPRGDKSAIMKYLIAFPPSLEHDVHIQQLAIIVMQFQKKISELHKENQNLAALRDTMLPKLMSGEIEVPV